MRRYRVQFIALLVLTLLAAGCGKKESLETKLGKIAVWEDEGWTDDGQLTKMLFDSDPAVRRRAALALGRVNDTLALDSSAIVLAEDGDPSIRAMAAFSFGPPRWRGAAPILHKALKTEKNPDVLMEILHACANVYARDSSEDFLPLLHHADPRVRAQALLTLDVLNLHSKLGDSIGSHIDDPDPQVRWAALYASVRGRSKIAGEKALSLCSDTAASIRRLAYKVVGGSQIENAADILIEGMRDPDPSVRAGAAETFGQNPDTIKVLTILPSLETEKDPRVLVSLIKAIGDNWRIAAEPYLKKLTNHPDPGVRTAAYKALTHRLDFNFAKLIAPAASDPNASVRFGYLEAVAEIRSLIQQLNVNDYLKELELLMVDTVPRIRAEAIKTYISLQGPESAHYLNVLYNDPDPQCVLTAVSLIGAFRVADYQDSLYALYPKYANQWRPEMKWAILASTANMSPSVFADSGRAQLFDQAMADPNRLVRWYAIAVWDKFRQDRRSELGRYYSEWTVDNINDLLTMYPSNPHATLNTTQGPVTLELRADLAPRTVRRFIQLAQEGYYDNCPMNDVQVFNLVHTGDRRGDGWGLPDETVRDEISPVRVEAGSVIWLISSRDSGHGAFAIALDRLPYLDWRYGIFARVSDGLDRARTLTMADSVRTVTISGPGT